LRYPLLAIALLAAPASLAEEPPPAASVPAPALAAPTEAQPAATETKPGTPPETEEPHAWELDLFIGYGQLAYPGIDMSNVSWSNGGPGVSVDVAYRGPHFTHPFFELSYVPVLSSGKNVNVFDPESGAGTVYNKNYAHALGFVIGAGWDIDWFRARAGIGFYDYEVQTFITGQNSLNTQDEITQLGLGFVVALTAFVWRPEPLALGIEARVVALQSPTNGIYQTMWELGITGRWDFVNVK
jgi:hypothetical protein